MPNFSPPADPSGPLMILLIVLVIIGAFVYFVPWLVAWFRGHPQTLAIFVLNLLLGWSLVGWVAALVWAVMSFESQRTDYAPRYSQPESKDDDFAAWR